MPLAIELAAARIKILSPDAILTRLDQQLDVLAAGSRDLPARQQTLRGAIAWSYDLLDDGGRRLLDRLSVFASGCDLDSAEAICGPASELGGDVLDGLMALVDQSLVKVEEIGRRRAAFPAARHDPGVRRGAARGRRRGRAHPGAPPRLVRRAGRRAPRRSCRAPTSGAGSTGSSSSTTTSGRSSIGRSPRPDPAGRHRRRLLDVAVLAEARPPRRGAPPARGDGGRAVVARRPATPGQAARGARRDVLVAGRASPRWASATSEALAIWEALGDEAELANAYYNASFTYRRRPGHRPGDRADPDPDRIGLSYLETGARHLPPDRRLRGARRTPCGGSATTTTSEATRATAWSEFRETLDHVPSGRRPDHGGVEPAHARDVAAAQRRCRRGARARRPRDPPFLRRRRRVGTDPDAGRPVGRRGRRWRPATRGPAPRRGTQPDDGDRREPRPASSRTRSSRASGPASARKCRTTTSPATAPRAPPGRSTRRSPTPSKARTRPIHDDGRGVGWPGDGRDPASDHRPVRDAGVGRSRRGPR